MYSNTNPLPGDSDETLLAKILERCGGSPTPSDLISKNNLLVKILRQLATLL